MDFSSAAELLKICQASGIPISQAMIDRKPSIWVPIL